jgi:two-component system response regulator QseB
MRLLLIEDDQDLADAIISGLKQKDILVDWISEGKSQEFFYPEMGYDVIILDLGLPKIPGLKVLQFIRKAQVRTPIIVLTARDSTNDCIEALNLGADDYMTKPFDLNELIARLRALDRRFNDRTETSLQYKNLILDPVAHTLTVDSNEIYLPRREFFLLQKFLENIGKVIARENLMQSIYSWDEEIDSNSLEVHIHNIRKKFEFLSLRTIRGIGYILEKDKS